MSQGQNSFYILRYVSLSFIHGLCLKVFKAEQIKLLICLQVLGLRFGSGKSLSQMWIRKTLVRI